MIIMIILNYKHVLRVHRDYFFWKNEPGSRLPCCCGYIFFDHPVDKPLMVVFSLNGFMGTTNAFFKPSIPLVQNFLFHLKISHSILYDLLITGMLLSLYKLSLLAFMEHLLQVIVSLMRLINVNFYVISKWLGPERVWLYTFCHTKVPP